MFLRTLLVRLGTAAISLFIICGISFGLAKASAGDLIALRTGEESMRGYTPEQRELLIQQFRLDKPWPLQYAAWLGDLVQGDWGRSFKDNRPVKQKIISRLPITLTINLLALFMMLLIAIPLGALSARYADRTFDRVTSVTLFLVFALPTFWVAILLQKFFSVRLQWFPLFGLGNQSFAQSLYYGFLPALTLALAGIPYIARFVRGHLLDQMPTKKIQAIQARGRSRTSAFLLHGFKAAGLPLLTLAGFIIPGLLSGSVLVEAIFGIPGLGGLFYDAILQRDLPLLTAQIALGGAATLLGILLSDLLYAWAEPRLRAG